MNADEIISREKSTKGKDANVVFSKDIVAKMAKNFGASLGTTPFSGKKLQLAMTSGANAAKDDDSAAASDESEKADQPAPKKKKLAEEATSTRVLS